MKLKYIVLIATSLSIVNSENLSSNTINSSVESVKKSINKNSLRETSVSSGLNRVTNDSFQRAQVSAEPISNQPNKILTISEATLKAINKARSQQQLCSKATTAVRWNESLYIVAKEHSIDMAVNGKVQHSGSGGKTDITAKRLKLTRGSFFYERVNQEKGSKKVYSGEIVIRSSISALKNPKELINYWMKSPKNCKVIMDSGYSDVALAKVVSNIDQKSYWTLLLAGKRAKDQ